MHTLHSLGGFSVLYKVMQERLVMAARGRLIRMMKPKSKRKDLAPPDHVRAHYNGSCKKEMAEMLCQLNFDKAV